MHYCCRNLMEELPTALPPSCTGGLFEYAALYTGGAVNWLGTTLCCSFSRPHSIIFILIFLSAIAVFNCSLFFICRALLRGRCRRGSYKLVPKPPSSTSTSSSSSEDTVVDPTACLFAGLPASPRPLQQRLTSTLIWLHVRPPKTRTQIQQVHTTAVFHEVKSEIVVFCDEVTASPSGMQERKLPRLLNSIARKLIVVLIIVAIICCTVYACIVGRTLELFVNQLPYYLTDTTTSVKFLTNSIISESYSILKNAIKEEVARTNAHSNLRPFVEEMKSIFADEAMRLYAMSMEMSPPSRSWLRKQSTQHLRHLNMFLRRLSSLFAVAPVLGHENINMAREICYSYSYELARLAPHPLLRLTRSIKDAWRSILILNETASELCRHPTSYFPNCSFVESYFAKIDKHIQSWPRMDDKSDLNKVTAYMRVPQLLNAEAYVTKWLPVAQDPIGGIPILFDELVIPEINKEIKKINESLDDISKIMANSSVNGYIRLSGKVPLALTGALTISVATFLIVMVFNWSGWSRVDQSPYEFLGYRYIRRCSTTTFGALAVIACFFTITGVLIGTSGEIGQSQVCIALLENPQATDKWLYRLINSSLSSIAALRPVLEIYSLNLRLPHFILMTMNADFIADGPPFLKAIGLNRPANLSAVLHSNWLNKTLYGLWYNEVWPHMLKKNLSSQVPRIPLTKVLTQFIKAVKLEQTFDELYVGNVSEYLPEPSHDYYTKIGLALDVISQRGFNARQSYSTYFSAVGQLINRYQLKYEQVAQSLDVIRENKGIIDALLPLITSGDLIMSYLASKSNTELVTQLTNNTAEIWLNSRQPINRMVLPIVYKILDRLFPYPNLGRTYRAGLAPICPTDNGTAPLFKTLRSFGLALSLSSLCLAVLCVVRMRRHLSRPLHAN